MRQNVQILEEINRDFEAELDKKDAAVKAIQEERLAQELEERRIRREEEERLKESDESKRKLEEDQDSSEERPSKVRKF